MRLKKYLSTLGIDFGVPICELKRRHGISRWKNYSDVISLPPVELFPGCRASFHVSPDQSANLSPEFITTTVFRTKDNRKTYEEIFSGISALLGAGQDVSASNTLSHQWKDEDLELKICTWPPELNQAFRGSNAISAVDPNYEFETHITISTESATLTLSSELFVEFKRIAVEMSLGRCSERWRDSAPRGQQRLIFLRNPEKGLLPVKFFNGIYLGYLGQTYSLVLEREKTRGLKLIRLTPARGGGGSSVQVIYDSGDKKSSTFTILSGMNTNDGDSLAVQIAEFWKLPLEAEEYPDD